MKEVSFIDFFERLDYYPLSLISLAIIGLCGYFFIPVSQRGKRIIQLSLWIILLVASYELLASFLSSQKIINLWVYNLFFTHLGGILFLVLIKNFLKRQNHKKAINILILLFLLISLALHLSGIAHVNDNGEYTTALITLFIMVGCSMYFFELISIEEFLMIDPLKEFSFWSSTAVFFYYSSSFMIFISFKYLYTNHLGIYYMVIEIPRLMAILCNCLFCLAIYSELLTSRFKLKIFHV